MTEKRLPRQPHHDVGILSQRPQHREPVDTAMRFAQNVDGLAFESVERCHGMAGYSGKSEVADFGYLTV